MEQILFYNGDINIFQYHDNKVYSAVHIFDCIFQKTNYLFIYFFNLNVIC